MMFRSLIVVTLLAGAPAAAQDVLDRIADESCTCIDDLTDLNDQGDQAKLGACMMAKALPYEKELRKKHGIDLSKGKEEGKHFGELIGARLALRCPHFTDLIKKKMKDAAVPPPPPLSTHEGTITEVLPGPFLHFIMRENDGRTIDLLMLEHFTNADLLQGPEAVNKKWRVAVNEQELYDAQAKAYRIFRVLKSAEPIE